MKTTQILRAIALPILLATALFTQAGVLASKTQADIVDTAAGNKSFTILVKAVQAAGLVDALKGEGPFTVFAPTDEAFQKLEKAKPGTLAMLLKPENKHKLVAILKYHVVQGKFLAHDVLKLKNKTKVKALNGQNLTVLNKKGVKINNSNVVKTDIMCTNGVIHVIDTVLLPN